MALELSWVLETWAFFSSQEPEGGLVVLSGGGTSGRMAFLMSVSTPIPGLAPSAFSG